MENRPLSFFIAGTMQGSGPGVSMASQDYRIQIAQIITDACPDAVIHDPLELMVEWFGDDAHAFFGVFQFLKSQSTVRTDTLGPEAKRVVAAFHELMALVAQVDVVVAYLPHYEASMGTAMEMWHAKANGKRVVAVTEMTHNLAILACADLIVPSIEALAAAISKEGCQLLTADQMPQ